MHSKGPDKKVKAVFSLFKMMIFISIKISNKLSSLHEMQIEPFLYADGVSVIKKMHCDCLHV